MAKKKIGEIYDKPIVIGDKNLVTENEIHVEDVYKISGEHNGGKSNIKYYDCLGDDHRVSHADNVKIVNTITGDITIAPYATYLDIDFNNSAMLATAWDTSKKIYIDGEYVDYLEYVQSMDSFFASEHKEITEEEFYHTLEDVVIPFGDRKKLGEVFEQCYSKLVEFGVLPSGNGAFNSTPINFPIPLLGYKTISVELHSEYTRTSPNLIHFFFTSTDFYRSADQWNWQENNRPEYVSDVEVVCLELCQSGIAMCRITYPDGTKEYLCPIIAG